MARVTLPEGVGRLVVVASRAVLEIPITVCRSRMDGQMAYILD